MIINSAIAGYYYLKPIVYMFLKEPLENGELSFAQNSTLTMKSLLGFCVILTIFAIFLIEPLLDIISYYVQVLGY